VHAHGARRGPAINHPGCSPGTQPGPGQRRVGGSATCWGLTQTWHGEKALARGPVTCSWAQGPEGGRSTNAGPTGDRGEPQRLRKCRNHCSGARQTGREEQAVRAPPPPVQAGAGTGHIRTARAGAVSENPTPGLNQRPHQGPRRPEELKAEERPTQASAVRRTAHALTWPRSRHAGSLRPGTGNHWDS